MLNEKNREIRQNGLGGSDVAAVLGLSKWKSALDVYLEKTGQIEPEDISDKPAVYFGNILEDVIAQEYAKRMGVEVLKEDKTLYHENHPFMFAHIDRWIGNKEYVLECKTTSMMNKNQWGEEGSDRIPVNYLTQVAWYAMITKVPRVDIAVLIGGQEFGVYHYHRNDKLEKALEDKTYDFWHNNVLKQLPPEANSNKDILKLYRDSVEETIIADSEILQAVEQLRALKQQSKIISDEITTFQQRVQEYMKQYGYLIDEHGNPLVTWKSSKPTARFDSKVFKEQNPDLYKQYMKQTPGNRVFLIK